MTYTPHLLASSIKKITMCARVIPKMLKRGVAVEG